MDSKEYNKITAFDSLFTTNHIQMLKIMLPYIGSNAQKSLAVCIKYMELQYTIDFYRNYPLSPCLAPEESFDFGKMCKELIPYCTPGEKMQMEQFQTMFHSMEMYREVSKAMELMKDFMPDMGSFAPGAASGGEGGGTDNMLQALMNMLSPEQMEIFNILGGNKHDE